MTTWKYKVENRGGTIYNVVVPSCTIWAKSCTSRLHKNEEVNCVRIFMKLN